MHHRRNRQVESLLQRAMSAQGGVQHLVGEAHPGTAGRETCRDLGPVGLIRGVQFSGIMQAEHDVIIGTAAALGEAENLLDDG